MTFKPERAGRWRAWIAHGLAVLASGLTAALAILWARSYWRVDAFDWVRRSPWATIVASGNVGRRSAVGLVSTDGTLRLERETTWANLAISYGELDRPRQIGWHTMTPAEAVDHWTAGFGTPRTGVVANGHQFGFGWVARDWNRGPTAFGYVGWHAQVPHVLPCGLAAAVSTLLWRRARRVARATRLGLCPRCGYDLRGTPERCPECGTVAVR